MKIQRSLLLDVFFLFLLTVLTIAFYRVIQPFLLDMFLSVVLTILTWKLYEKLSSKMRIRYASFLSTLIFFLVTAGLITLISLLFASETADGYAAIKSKWPNVKLFLENFKLFGFLDQIPFLHSLTLRLQKFQFSEIISKSMNSGVDFLFSMITRSFANISRGIIHFLLIIFLMYYFYLDGPAYLKRIKELIPLNSQNTDALIQEIVNITRATAISTILIGLIEGGFGWVLFLTFGIPSPVFWGIIIVIVSMIPLIGTNTIIIPAGIILIASGRWIAGIFLILIGFSGITLSQYFLKPRLLAGRSGLHPALILLSILGGLIWLGLIGFLVGPMVTALFIAIWNQFGIRFKSELIAREKE